MASDDGRPSQLKFCMACHCRPDCQHACLPPAKSVLVKRKSNYVNKHLKGDRLALAMRLAKRDLLHGLVHEVPSTHLESAPFPSSCVHTYSSPHQYGQCEGAVVKEVEAQDKHSVVRSNYGSKCITGEGYVLKGEKCRPLVNFAAHTASQARGEKGQLSGGGCMSHMEEAGMTRYMEQRRLRCMEEGSMSNIRDKDELTALKLELREQVKRLRELCTQQSELEREVLGEGEEEEGEERKKSAEHVALMVRKLYDLKRQVFQSCKQSSGGLLCKKKQSAACRATTRTLRSYRSTSHPLPNELLHVAEKICGKQDGYSSQLLSQAQMYSDTLRTRQKARHGRSFQEVKKKPKRKKTKDKPQKQLNVLPWKPLRPSGDRTRRLLHFNCPRDTTIPARVRSRPLTHAHSAPSASKCAGKKKRNNRYSTTPASGPQTAGKHLTEHVHRVEEREEETHLEDPIIVAHPLPPPPAPPSPPLLPLPAATTTSTTPSPLIPPNVPYNNEKFNQPMKGESEVVRSLSHSNVVAMVSRLQQMEEVELEVRQKWCREAGYPNNTPSSPSSSSSCTHSIFDHPHLSTCKVLVDKRPFELVERLADQMLQEVLDRVCQEVEQVCHDLTQNLFWCEFFRASD